MSQYPATRTATTAPTAGGGIDLKTLWITAVASAAAAFACSKLWAPGTLAAAAFTPVLVAVIREALAKSTAVVAKAVPVRGVVRSARPEGPQPLDPGAVSGDWSAASLAASSEPGPSEDPAARVPQAGEITYHGASGRRRGLRMAVVTGLLGFLIAAVVFTVPELIAGGSAAGGGRETTLFGKPHHNTGVPAVTTTTTTAPVKTVTAPPQSTVTVPPQTVTTPPPTTTVPPAATAAPTTTTPPPVVAEPPPVQVPPG
jgi:hypothetical protein